MEISKVLVKRPCLSWNDPLVKGLLILAEKRSPYRIAVVDKGMRIRGILTGRRILEVLLGIRGTSLREKKGLDILNESVNLFIDEARHLFESHIPLRAVIQYMVENSIGQVFVVDQRGVLKGVIDEVSILDRIENYRFESKIKDIMVRDVKLTSLNSTLSDAARIMVDNWIRRLPVVEGGVIKGLVTITDVLGYIRNKVFSEGRTDLEGVMNTRVNEIMKKEPITASSHERLDEAIEKIKRYDISTLPVVERRVLVGMVTRIDILKGIVREKGAEEVSKLIGRYSGE